MSYYTETFPTSIDNWPGAVIEYLGATEPEPAAMP